MHSIESMAAEPSGRPCAVVRLAWIKRKCVRPTNVVFLEGNQIIRCSHHCRDILRFRIREVLGHHLTEDVVLLPHRNPEEGRRQKAGVTKVDCDYGIVRKFLEISGMNIARAQEEAIASVSHQIDAPFVGYMPEDLPWS